MHIQIWRRMERKHAAQWVKWVKYGTLHLNPLYPSLLLKSPDSELRFNIKYGRHFQKDRRFFTIVLAILP